MLKGQVANLFGVDIYIPVFRFASLLGGAFLMQ